MYLCATLTSLPRVHEKISLKASQGFPAKEFCYLPSFDFLVKMTFPVQENFHGNPNQKSHWRYIGDGTGNNQPIMRFARCTPCALIGIGKLFHYHQRGDREGSKLKELKEQQLHQSPRSHPGRASTWGPDAPTMTGSGIWTHRHWTGIKFLVLESLTSDFLFFYWPSYGSVIFQLNNRGLLKKQSSCGSDHLMCLHIRYYKSNEFQNMLWSIGKSGVF